MKKTLLGCFSHPTIEQIRRFQINNLLVKFLNFRIFLHMCFCSKCIQIADDIYYYQSSCDD